LARRRTGQLAGMVAAIALGVGFLAALGSFVATDRAHLTDRAARGVAVDWQVQATAPADLRSVRAAVRHVPHQRTTAPVDIAAVPSLSTTTGGATRTTGRAFVVGMPATYATQFPGELRSLVGHLDGPVLLQQTAANLAVTPGATVTVHPARGPARQVRISGIVDMPLEDSFFQTVGAPAGVGPTAPPDNVVLVPNAQVSVLARGATVVHQLHVAFDHNWLPSDPSAAAVADDQARNHLEVQLAGGGLVGDNLGAALSAAREDALYGELLFLLLGLPAFAVALAVTALVVSVGAEHRVRHLAVLRLRGAGPRQLVSVSAAEAMSALVPGVVLGWPVGLLAAQWAFGRGAVSWPWFGVGAGSLVLLVGVLQCLTLRRRDGRGDGPLPGSRAMEVPASGRPWPLRVGLDVILLAISGFVFWLVARGGYQVVVAPEGVPSTSVDWAALLAPALLWPGLTLLVWRLVDAVLAHRRSLSNKAGAELVMAALRRRRRVAARAATVLAVAVGVAGSTAVFTATYRQQSRLDVALTVGADVAVQLPTAAVDAAQVTGLATRAPGVHATSVQSHRFAYVGSDLQDFYGVDPATIARATPLSDSFVPGGTISSAMHALAAQPDGVLLSAETLHDYQLHPGDHINLRLQIGPAQRYQPIQFTVLGQVAEWPTAPKDSFIVANAAHVATVTGQPGVKTMLLASGSPGATAQWLRAHAGPSVAVSDIDHARTSVTTASGLAATDLSGLAKLELGFGAVLAVSAFALALLVGVLQRRRALVILAALGANARQRGRFLAAEARAILVGGLLGGAALTAAVAAMLVKVMTGIFDPPPDHPTVPWSYLLLLGLAVATTAVGVVTVVGRWAGRAGPRELRDL
ncbi:MAG: putative transport system permease protein, partial [Nocardioidaceae bacterium]|nr:putative transport system permease protein [Nocardioidaceae bacterium]